VIHLPRGVAVTSGEAFGEVQSPVQMCSGSAQLALDDVVLIRPAKGGEIAERFNMYTVVADARCDPATAQRVATYRGEGMAFH
jgi:D-serine deaminase-like pyridoxal phosphate-dependent protein